MKPMSSELSFEDKHILYNKIVQTLKQNSKKTEKNLQRTYKRVYFMWSSFGFRKLSGNIPSRCNISVK